MDDTLPPKEAGRTFRYEDAERIWRYTAATERYASAMLKEEMITSAEAARQAALDLAKSARDEDGAAAWIEIAEVWAERAGQQG